MRWVLIIGGGIIGLAVLVVIVGALLPRDHVVARTAHIAAPPDTVWRTITDAEHSPAWRHELDRVDMLPLVNGFPSWREYSKNGALTMVIDVVEAPRRLVTRIADKDLPFGGTWEYRVAPDSANGSRVTITERGSVSNPVFRFVSRFIMGHTSTIDAYLKALGRKFGKDATPETVSATASGGI